MKMASEAQRLIGISLTKIAQSRSHRGGVSLHKNLLVATVLQKARYVFMEEAYNMVHYQTAGPIQPRQQVPEDDLVGLTAEEAGLDPVSVPDDIPESSTSGSLQDFLQQSCEKCSANQDKENHPPSFGSSELTYFDLDNKSSNVLRERSNSCLKRRRAVSEWETEEAVQSILPKKSKHDDESDDVFLDDASLLSDVVSKEVEAAEGEKVASSQESSGAAASASAGAGGSAPNSAGAGGNGGGSGSAMEIDRITSLVSIFSFSMGDGKLTRSVSTPDLCSAQAKDTPDGIQQRPFLAMTV